jgi:hypothetical protein
MDFRISGGSPDFERGLLALIDKHLAAGDVTVEPDVQWTPERAEAFWRCATPPARTLTHAVVERDGFVSADTLRDRQFSLKSLSGSVTSTVTRGIREGLWPDGIPNPVVPEYAPETPSWQQVLGYRMPAELVKVFRDADERMEEEFKSRRRATS